MDNWQIATVVVLCMIAVYLWFNTEHLTNDNGKPYIVLFSQDWCPACRDFRPIWEKFKKMDVVTAVVNPIELDPAQYSVGSYPTIRYYKRDPQQYPTEFVTFKDQRNIGQLLKFVRDNNDRL
jgi:thiol-disulfide isomerase/thioredoxin